MTTYATRVPLQVLGNTHTMTDSHGDYRRSSSRLREKENVDEVMPHMIQALKKTQGVAVAQEARGSKLAGEKKTATAATKRKQVYDEEDDGFAFTRTRPKKAKTDAVPSRTAQKPQSTDAARPSEPRKKRRANESAGNAAASAEPVRRRSARLSGEAQDSDNGGAPPRLVVGKKNNKSRPTMQAPADVKPPAQDRVEWHSDATKIALPFADTPIIRRNQKMRREASSGSRRSSLGMRGRRASSLIDSGKSNALPHDEVDSSSFFKHIEGDGLSEPRRMKQLLTWCGTRALGQKVSMTGQDANAVLAAREIQSQLLKDFATKSSLSDWFSRIDGPKPPSPPRPNPKNLANQARIKELRQQLQRLKLEKESWQSMLEGPRIEPVLSKHPSSSINLKTIDTALLSSDLRTIYSDFANLQASTSESLSAQVAQRTKAVGGNLELSIDTFAHNTHVLSSYISTADRLAVESLASCAHVLEERDRQGLVRATEVIRAGEEQASTKSTAGMRDVLRGLSRVIDR